MRNLYRETSVDVEALDRGLREIAACPIRIVLLHYAPTAATIAGEPEGIWTFLGTDRLAAPIAEHGPDLVLHGHAHAGTFAGAIGDVPVRNVSVQVMDRDFWLFELAALRRAQPQLGVQRVEYVAVALVDHVALDLQARRQLAGLDRQVVVEDRELLDLLDLRVVGVRAVELLLDQLDGPLVLGQLREVLRAAPAPWPTGRSPRGRA